VGTEKRERQRANRQLKYEQQAKEQRRSKLTRRILIGAAAVVGGVGLVFFLGWAFGSDSDDDTPTVSESTVPATVPPTSTPATGDTTATTTSTSAEPAAFTYGTGECPPEEVSEPVREFTAAPQLCIDPAADYTARFVTDRGDIVVDLATADVPGTVNNFVTLANWRFYDDTLIFRTDPSIDIIQGGGRSNTDQLGYTIPDEGSGFTYPPGVIAMANTKAPNSAGAQWFFALGPNSAQLDSIGTYVVFGEIVEGMDVAESILALAPEEGDTPTEEVVLERVEITQA
jgi:cyclophilin family peptidyl-prolyl cis-trans isomerase